MPKAPKFLAVITYAMLILGWTEPWAGPDPAPDSALPDPTHEVELLDSCHGPRVPVVMDSRGSP